MTDEKGRPMTYWGGSPAAPESKTPRCDALHRNPLDSNDLRAWWNLASDLEHQISLAQTEIKGHMRVKDDLEAELRAANEAAMRWYAAASPYATPEALREALDRLKDRA